jgi:hypothetical protein
MVTFFGNFPDQILAIHLDGKPLPIENWTQTTGSVSIRIPTGTFGKISIQIFNGTTPVLPAQLVVIPVFVSQPSVVKPVEVIPAPTATPKPVANNAKAPSKTKLITIKCVKGKTVKTVKGTRPKCPTGYVKK